ncbi:MAG TPA: hypothetical protein PLT28_00375 [Saprospiraceae bacterium]|nr:hypothetical protein [Saprospiraceae bacterium]
MIQNFTQLDRVSMIAGDTAIFEYDVFNSATQEAVELINFHAIKWMLFNYGYPDNPIAIIDFDLETLGANYNRFKIEVDGVYTQNLHGLYMQQVYLLDGQDKEFYPAQGEIFILPRGKMENYVQTLSIS